MPKIVDREKVRTEILSAFEACVLDKPISNISLRDIAAKAKMTHPKLLNYFSTKEDIVLSYLEFTKCSMAQLCEKWFDTHDASDYPSRLAYLNDFICHFAEAGTDEARPRARMQIGTLGKYDINIKKNVAEEHMMWKDALEKGLEKLYGTDIGPAEAEALAVLIFGTVACRYCGTLTGAANKDMFTHLNKILQISDTPETKGN